MIELMDDFPENIVGMTGKGEITAADYENVFMPAIEQRLARFPKIRLLYFLGPEFTGYTPKAMWDDTKIGIRHPTAFEKIAVISDAHWVIHLSQVMAMLLPCPVRTFPVSQLTEAKAWILAD